MIISEHPSIRPFPRPRKKTDRHRPPPPKKAE